MSKETIMTRFTTLSEVHGEIHRYRRDYVAAKPEELAAIEAIDEINSFVLYLVEAADRRVDELAHYQEIVP